MSDREFNEMLQRVERRYERTAYRHPGNVERLKRLFNHFDFR